jgi:hypothetical protein
MPRRRSLSEIDARWLSMLIYKKISPVLKGSN